MEMSGYPGAMVVLVAEGVSVAEVVIGPGTSPVGEVQQAHRIAARTRELARRKDTLMILIFPPDHDNTPGYISLHFFGPMILTPFLWNRQTWSALFRI